MKTPESNTYLSNAKAPGRMENTLSKLCGVAAMLVATTVAGCGDDMEVSRINTLDTDAACDLDAACDSDATTDSDGNFNDADASTMADGAETGSDKDAELKDDTNNGGKYEASVDANLEEDSAPEAAADVIAEVSSDVAKDCGSLTNCNDQCVDLVTDPANCGACGNACPGDKPYCTPTGGCQECPGTLQKCPGTSDCIDLNYNDQHCGGCGPGLACNGGEHCNNGICQ